jgi:Aspartyl protease
VARAPITFETADGGTTHAPLVFGRIRGLETRFVLDTGSEVHLITKELADELDLALEPGEEGVDHSGATMPSWTVEDLALELGGADLTLRDVVCIPAPAPFPRGGIGGILSPQHLRPSAQAVIDLISDELVLTDDADQLSPGLRTLVLERDPSFTSVVVPAAIRPFPEIPTLLNTGGRNTEFSATAVPGLAADAMERIGAGVSGADVLAAKMGEATLVVGGEEVGVEELAVRGSMHDPQGMVGMDVLRGTILTVTADLGRPVVWQLPAR